jgi:ligand-binding sensor domain-containing protein
MPGGESIRALVRQGDILWAATEGGLLRWNTTTLVYDRLTAADGLGSDRVNGVAIAPDGTVWAATAGGLSRYAPGRQAGVGWLTHTRENTDRGLVDDEVLAVAVDGQGRIWAGTAHGLCRLTPDVDDLGGTWSTISAEGLSAIRVHALQTDGQGRVWVATSAGLFRAEGDVLHAEEAGGLLSDAAIAALGVDGGGRLWVAAQDGPLVHFEPRGEQWIAVPEGRPAGEVMALAAGNTSERMWVAAGGGLGRVHLVGRSPAAAWQALALPKAVADAGVTALTLDESGVLWVGTGNGLFRYWEIWNRDPAGPETTVRVAANQYEYARFAFDDRGNLWAPKGLKRFDGRAWTGFSEAERVADRADHGLDIAGDGAGGVWAAHRYGAISHFDGRAWQAFTYQDQGLWDDRRTMAIMAPDRGGGLWVGYEDLAHVAWQDAARSGVDWRVFHFNWGRVLDVAVDGLDGAWIATSEWGLVRYVDGAWTAYPTLSGRSGDRPERVTAIALDARGRLWTSSAAYGVALFDGRTWRVHPMTQDMPGYVARFAPDATGGTWALNGDDSVSYLDDDSWWVYTRADGLPGQVYGIAVNPVTDRVWLSTAVGFLRYDGPRWERLDLQ